jgi:predicted Zn-dependent peptidase
LIEAIEKVTAADLIRLAETCLATPKPTIAALGPQGSVLGAGLAAKVAA